MSIFSKLHAQYLYKKKTKELSKKLASYYEIYKKNEILIQEMEDLLEEAEREDALEHEK